MQLDEYDTREGEMHGLDFSLSMCKASFSARLLSLLLWLYYILRALERTNLKKTSKTTTTENGEAFSLSFCLNVSDS